MAEWKDETQRRLQGLRLRPEREAEIADELAQHLEDRYAELCAAGVDAETAARTALSELDENGGLARQLAGVERRAQEPVALGAERKGGRLAGVVQDLRYGLRMLRRSPGFTAVALLTLALGIGANAAIFSVLDAVLLKPLPLPDSEKLLYIMAKTREGRSTWLSWPDFEDLKRQASRFEGFSAFVPQSVNLTGRDEPARVRGGFVSDTFFRVVGVEPAQGRGFLSGVDDAPGAERVCVLQHETWQSLFGGSPSLLGEKLLLNNEPFTVVGILPQGFRFPFDEIEVWIPYRNWPVLASLNLQDRSVAVVGPIARVKAGASLEQASTELEAIMARLSRQFPEAGEGRGLNVSPLQEVLVEDVRPSLLVLFGTVAFVLLIACGNVANLLLARAAVRQRELATRAALGASQGRLVQQMLTETGLLWLGGGLAGLFVGYLALKALLAGAPDELPGGNKPGLDLAVLAYTLGVTALSALFFGLLPALRSSRPDLNEVLKEGGGRGTSEARHRARLRSSLVVSQFALALVLLVGCGLMLRSFERLSGVDPGFRSENLLTMEYRLPRNKYPEAAQQTQFHREVVERVRRVPGVISAAAIRGLPFSGNGGSVLFSLPERPETAEDPNLRAQYNTVDPYTFQAMAIPLLRGRNFNEQDRAGAPPVAIVNRRLAERYWPGQDPVGRQLALRDEPTGQVTIVGVVGDIRHWGLDETELPQIYRPQAQDEHIFNTLVARTAGQPMLLARAVTEAVWAVDPQQPVWKVRTLESLIDRSVRGRRFVLQLMLAYSALALLLAAVGIAGVTGYTVAQRSRELGVRMALGADRSSIFRLVVGQGMRLAGFGAAIGLAGAFGLTRFIESMLFGVRPHDPLTFTLAAALLAGVALVACALPARRATRLDPLTTLRCE